MEKGKSVREVVIKNNIERLPKRRGKGKKVRGSEGGRRVNKIIQGRGGGRLEKGPSELGARKEAGQGGVFFQ